jgi:uncharacterized membrane protein YeiH
MITPAVDVQLVLDLLGIFVFALSGGLVGVRARLDLFGVAVLAWVAGLGGGIIRDVLLGATPPVGIYDPRYLGTVLVSGLLVFAFHGRYVELRSSRPRLRLDRISASVKVLDALGLSVFAVVGAMKALDLGAPALACVLVGVITAVGGGMLRDVIVGQIPEVLRRELYAVPALIGATVVVVADRADLLNLWVVWAAVLLVFTIRMTAVRYDLNAPTSLTTGERA